MIFANALNPAHFFIIVDAFTYKNQLKSDVYKTISQIGPYFD